MSQSIIIESINFDGEFATIILTPYNNDNVVNIGLQQLPYTFNPSLINPLLEIYGTYTLVINENGKDCTYFLNVIKETPTPTPTITPTKTQTPTPTITPTVTPSFNPCPPGPPSPTPTKTTTPTPTPVYFAYLFIEPVSGSEDIGQWMYDNNRDFFGFTNYSQPAQDQVKFNIDMNTYVDFSGWTSGLFPSLIQQTVPQVSGGEDEYSNAIVAYNFLTTEIPNNYVNGYGWYTWMIPVSLTNNERQTIIDINTSNNPNLMTGVGTENTINSYTFTYTGTTILPTTYRVYTTYPNTIFKITDTQNIYMRGNTITP
jgi:hypothetical protein